MLVDALEACPNFPKSTQKAKFATGETVQNLGSEIARANFSLGEQINSNKGKQSDWSFSSGQAHHWPKARITNGFGQTKRRMYEDSTCQVDLLLITGKSDSTMDVSLIFLSGRGREKPSCHHLIAGVMRCHSERYSPPIHVGLLVVKFWPTS